MVTHNPLHRSGRAGFPHPALASGDDATAFSTFITKYYEPWATAQRKTGAEQTARLRSVFGTNLGDLPLQDISAFHVESWRSKRLKAGRTAATVNRDLNTLRRALSLAMEIPADPKDPKGATLLGSHPLAKMKALNTDKRAKVRYLSADEETRLLTALSDRDDQRRAKRARANDWRAAREYVLWPDTAATPITSRR